MGGSARSEGLRRAVVDSAAGREGCPDLWNRALVPLARLVPVKEACLGPSLRLPAPLAGTPLFDALELGEDARAAVDRSSAFRLFGGAPGEVEEEVFFSVTGRGRVRASGRSSESEPESSSSLREYDQSIVLCLACCRKGEEEEEETRQRVACLPFSFLLSTVLPFLSGPRYGQVCGPRRCVRNLMRSLWGGGVRKRRITARVEGRMGGASDGLRRLRDRVARSRLL